LQDRFAYSEGDAVAPGYHLEKDERTGLVAGGAFMIGVPYMLGVFPPPLDEGSKMGRASCWFLLPDRG
jgi:hypothetical protein